LDSEDGSSASSDPEDEDVMMDVRASLREGLRTKLVKKEGNEENLAEEDLERWQGFGCFLNFKLLFAAETLFF